MKGKEHESGDGTGQASFFFIHIPICRAPSFPAAPRDPEMNPEYHQPKTTRPVLRLPGVPPIPCCVERTLPQIWNFEYGLQRSEVLNRGTRRIPKQRDSHDPKIGPRLKLESRIQMVDCP